MSLLSVSHLGFCYDTAAVPVFCDLNLQLDTSWRLGLIGRNGKGKTTFLQLLLGRGGYTGQITAAPGLRFAAFPPPHPPENLSARAAVAAAYGEQPDWRLEREAALLDLDPALLDMPFAALSGGEQTKAFLAGLFLCEGALPLIDEPTNHLDLHGRAAVSRYLNGKPGFILVSHDRAFLDGCIDHVLAFNRASVGVQRGNYSTWQENRAKLDQAELAQHAKLQKEVKRLKQAARQAADWSNAGERGKFATRNSGLRVDRGYVGHKAAKMMKRATVITARREDAVTEKAALLKDYESAEPLRLSPLTHPQKTLLRAKALRAFYGGRAVLGGIDLCLAQGERLALCGKNGCGKSTLLKLICGLGEKDLRSEGTLFLASGLTLSYVPQKTEFLRGNILEFVHESGIDQALFLAILRKLDFTREEFEHELQELSAGQRKKILLARSLCEQAHLYIWDEPLNYIDVLSRVQIERLLCEYRPTMLFVEHDAAFCAAVATRQLTL